MKRVVLGLVTQLPYYFRQRSRISIGLGFSAGAQVAARNKRRPLADEVKQTHLNSQVGRASRSSSRCSRRRRWDSIWGAAEQTLLPVPTKPFLPTLPNFPPTSHPQYTPFGRHRLASKSMTNLGSAMKGVILTDTGEVVETPDRGYTHHTQLPRSSLDELASGSGSGSTSTSDGNGSPPEVAPPPPRMRTPCTW